MHSKPIRAFSRGLAVLEALNQHGSATAQDLANETGIPRPTVYRLLRTLMDAGYIGRGLGDERFHLRLQVRALSGGFKDEQWITAVAAPLLMELTERISWPCDVCTLDGLAMVIRDTTHFRAPLSIDRNVVGRHMPLFSCAAGEAYIAFAPLAERNSLLDCLAQSDAPVDALAKDRSKVSRLVAATRRRGYGRRQGGSFWPDTGAIALPICHGKRVLGCISVIWMARVIGLEEGVRQCLAPLQETKALIEERLAGAPPSEMDIFYKDQIS